MSVCVRKLLQESQPQQKLINNCLVSKDKAAPMQQQKEREGELEKRPLEKDNERRATG